MFVQHAQDAVVPCVAVHGFLGLLDRMYIHICTYATGTAGYYSAQYSLVVRDAVLSVLGLFVRVAHSTRCIRTWHTVSGFEVQGISTGAWNFYFHDDDDDYQYYDCCCCEPEALRPARIPAPKPKP